MLGGFIINSILYSWLLQISQISILVTKSAVVDYFDGRELRVFDTPPSLSMDTNFVLPALMTIYVTSPPGSSQLPGTFF